MKAMIFAAGLGTRLKPLTDTLPKALVPVCGKPLIEHVTRKITSAGIDDIVVNVHYFADKIEAWINEQEWITTDRKSNGKTRFAISDERTSLLETGGAILHARPHLEGCGSFLIHNVDILSDCDLQQFIASQRDEALATLLVSNRKTSRYFLFNPTNLRLVGWMNTATGEHLTISPETDPAECRALAFTGIHMMSDKVFTLMEEYIKEKQLPGDTASGTRFPIKDFYLWAASRKPIYAVEAENLRLIDVGKLDALKPAEEFILSQENR